MKLLITYNTNKEEEINLKKYNLTTSKLMLVHKKDDDKSVSLDDVVEISFCEDLFILDVVDKIIETLLIYNSKENRKIKLSTYKGADYGKTNRN